MTILINNGTTKAILRMTANNTIPNSISKIGESTFEKCKSHQIMLLQFTTCNITIPNGVTKIDKYAFPDTCKLNYKKYIVNLYK